MRDDFKSERDVKKLKTKRVKAAKVRLKGVKEAEAEARAA